jgi:hypothetical protein
MHFARCIVQILIHLQKALASHTPQRALLADWRFKQNKGLFFRHRSKMEQPRP